MVGRKKLIMHYFICHIFYNMWNKQINMSQDFDIYNIIAHAGLQTTIDTLKKDHNESYNKVT